MNPIDALIQRRVPDYDFGGLLWVLRPSDAKRVCVPGTLNIYHKPIDRAIAPANASS